METNEKNYKYVFDLKYSPMMRAQIAFQSLTLKKPTVCWGLVELVSKRLIDYLLYY